MMKQQWKAPCLCILSIHWSMHICSRGCKRWNKFFPPRKNWNLHGQPACRPHCPLLTRHAQNVLFTPKTHLAVVQYHSMCTLSGTAVRPPQAWALLYDLPLSLPMFWGLVAWLTLLDGSEITGRHFSHPGEWINAWKDLLTVCLPP